MKDKLVKTYTAAWRWPELFSHDPVVIWTSRLIVFALPVGLILLTFITGVPLYGWIFTGIYAFLVLLGILGATIKMFYPEYSNVENFQTRESRIKQYFHGFPKHTDIPLVEYEPKEWVSYGHVEPRTFIEAIQKVIIEATGDSEASEQFTGQEISVGHTYATFRNEGHWDEGLELCKAHEEDCFPITRIKL